MYDNFDKDFIASVYAEGQPFGHVVQQNIQRLCGVLSLSQVFANISFDEIKTYSINRQKSNQTAAQNNYNSVKIKLTPQSGTSGCKVN